MYSCSSIKPQNPNMDLSANVAYRQLKSVVMCVRLLLLLKEPHQSCSVSSLSVRECGEIREGRGNKLLTCSPTQNTPQGLWRGCCLHHDLQTCSEPHDEAGQQSVTRVHMDHHHSPHHITFTVLDAAVSKPQNEGFTNGAPHLKQPMSF